MGPSWWPRTNPSGINPPTVILQHLNSRGISDGSSSTPNFNAPIAGFCELPNNQIMVYGQFTEVSGSPSNGIARLNSDFSLDTTFSMTGW